MPRHSETGKPPGQNRVVLITATFLTRYTETVSQLAPAVRRDGVLALRGLYDLQFQGRRRGNANGLLQLGVGDYSYGHHSPSRVVRHGHPTPAGPPVTPGTRPLASALVRRHKPATARFAAQPNPHDHAISARRLSTDTVAIVANVSATPKGNSNIRSRTMPPQL